MSYGENYRRHLEAEYQDQLYRAKQAKSEALERERIFGRFLLPDEAVTRVSNESLRKPEVYRAREEFRQAHIAWCRQESRLSEIEEELYPWPELR